MAAELAAEHRGVRYPIQLEDATLAMMRAVPME